MLLLRWQSIETFLVQFFLQTLFARKCAGSSQAGLIQSDGGLVVGWWRDSFQGVIYAPANQQSEIICKFPQIPAHKAGGRPFLQIQFSTQANFHKQNV